MYGVYCVFLWLGVTLAFGSTYKYMVTDPLRFGRNEPKEAKLESVTGKVERNVPDVQKRILNDLSWGLRLALLKNISSPKEKDVKEDDVNRKVNIQALVLPVDEKEKADDLEADDANMKMKLFRLMYETVRDSDLKVRRADIIKKSYANNSAFEVGYLLGDVTDKYHVMSDIAVTLKRLYHEWKPIEHINAYEQIANLVIDIGHIVDMVKAAERRGSTARPVEPVTDRNYSDINEQPGALGQGRLGPYL